MKTIALLSVIEKTYVNDEFSNDVVITNTVPLPTHGLIPYTSEIEAAHSWRVWCEPVCILDCSTVPCLEAFWLSQQSSERRKVRQQNSLAIRVREPAGTFPVPWLRHSGCSPLAASGVKIPGILFHPETIYFTRTHTHTFFFWQGTDPQIGPICSEWYSQSDCRKILEPSRSVWASYQIRKNPGCACAGMPGTFSPPPRVSDPNMHHRTCVPHVPWCMLGSLTSGLLWNRWREKRSRHSRGMHNPQVYESGKRPIGHLTPWSENHGYRTQVWDKKSYRLTRYALLRD